MSYSILNEFRKVFSCFMVLTIVIINCPIEAQEQWGTVEENHQARSGNNIVKLSDDRVMMFGGEDANADLFDDLHLFEDNDWSLVTTTGETPGGRKDAAAWYENGKVMVMGGIDENQQLLEDLWGFDLTSKIWIEEVVTGPSPGARRRFGAVPTDEQGTLIIGGQVGDFEYKDDVWSYSSSSNSFSYLGKTDMLGFTQWPNNCPHEVWGQILFVFNGMVVIPEVFMGATTMFRLELNSAAWQSSMPAGNKPPFSPLAAVVELANGILKIGGWGYFSNALYKTEGFEASNETWYYDYTSNLWSREADLPVGLFSATAYYDSVNQRVKVYGGMKADSTVNDLVYTLPFATTDVESSEELPMDFVLKQNYPNPFNPSTNIQYILPSSGKIKLSIFDILGQEIAVLEDGIKPAGTHEVEFNADKLNSGVYFYSLKTDLGVQTKKFVYLK